MWFRPSLSMSPSTTDVVEQQKANSRCNRSFSLGAEVWSRVYKTPSPFRGRANRLSIFQDLRIYRANPASFTLHLRSAATYPMHTLCNYSSSLPSHVKACCLAFYMRPYTYLSFTLHDLASVWRSTLSSLLSLSLSFCLCVHPLSFAAHSLSLDSPLFHPVLCLLSLSLSVCFGSSSIFLPLSLSPLHTHTLAGSLLHARLLSHVPVFHQRQPINKTPSSKNAVHFPRCRLAATLAP